MRSGDPRPGLAARLASGLAHAAALNDVVLASPRASLAVRTLVDAVEAATGATASLLRRAANGAYAAVTTLDARPANGSRAPAGSSPPFRFEDAMPDELVLPVPGTMWPPELVVAVRGAKAGPDEGDLAILDALVSSFGLAVRLVAVTAELERKRVDLREARAAQAELVARFSRDVRGPVTSIVGFARLLEEDGRFPTDAREALAMIGANGERVAEVAADADLLSRIELAAVDPRWRTVDVAALAAAAGALIDRRSKAEVFADPDLLGPALERLIADGQRASSPVRAKTEDLDEAVALELSGTGASPAGERNAPTVGGRLAERIVERHGGTLRAGALDGRWWIRLTLPYDPRRLRPTFAGPNEGEDLSSTA
ncbi:MAG: hypothetical protein JO103_01470 [Candidatus Eremiobacteraeota bacterium]|nr:hypothetical protein [Candidatus Eremiobacteraeota bacterium]MBV9407347.1 hypothetical protein [Candidatus Eremiobacteraeota bacterium]